MEQVTIYNETTRIFVCFSTFLCKPKTRTNKCCSSQDSFLDFFHICFGFKSSGDSW